jgi:hypothetical protein
MGAKSSADGDSLAAVGPGVVEAGVEASSLTPGASLLVSCVAERCPVSCGAFVSSVLFLFTLFLSLSSLFASFSCDGDFGQLWKTFVSGVSSVRARFGGEEEDVDSMGAMVNKHKNGIQISDCECSGDLRVALFWSRWDTSKILYGCQSHYKLQNVRATVVRAYRIE